MAESLPTITPPVITAGDRAKWTLRTVVFGDHKDPADGWALAYDLRGSDRVIDFSGSDNGDGTHLISLAPTDTADYPPGIYYYQAAITLATDRYVVATGRICVEPNYAALGTHDARIWAERVSEALEAVIEGKATTDQQSYSIGGRSLARMSWEELLAARDRLYREVRAARQAEDIAAGRGHGGIIRTRL